MPRNSEFAAIFHVQPGRFVGRDQGQVDAAIGWARLRALCSPRRAAAEAKAGSQPKTGPRTVNSKELAYRKSSVRDSSAGK